MFSEKISKAVTTFGIFLIFLLIVVLIWFQQEDIKDHGRSFDSRTKMCYQFVVDYLKNARQDPMYTPDNEPLIIDIETEIYRLCQLDLSEEAAGQYSPEALKKYSPTE